MSKRQNKISSVSALNHSLRRPDLAILGNAVTSLPTAQWQERMFFMGVPDTDLARQTGGGFPASFRPDMDTHPVFVLQSGTVGPLLCPCSSQGNRQKFRYIRCGCRLEMKDFCMDRDSFLIEDYVFTMPLDTRFSRKLLFKGRVPEHCIAGGDSR